MNVAENVVHLNNRPPPKLRKYWVALEPDDLGNEYAPVPVLAHYYFDNSQKDENNIIFRRYSTPPEVGSYISAQFDADAVRYITLDENFADGDL